MNKIIIKFLIYGFALNVSHGAFQAKVHLNTGAILIDNQIDIIDNSLILGSKKSTINTSFVNNIEFLFNDFNLQICESLFKRGKYTSLEGLLEEISLLRKFSNLKSNLNIYYSWLLKSQIWNNNIEEAKESIEFLSLSNDETSKVLSDLYNVYILLLEDDYINAKKYLSKIKNPDEVSESMTLYLKSKIDFHEKKYSNSLEKISKIQAFHAQDEEWIPPTLILELNIYLEKKQYERASNVIDEIKWSYPNSYWINNVELLLEKYSLGGMI